jgi:hypothetical protein
MEDKLTTFYEEMYGRREIMGLLDGILRLVLKWGMG